MAEGRFTNPVVASLAGFRDLFSGQKLANRLSDDDRAVGKTVLITGANSGLGYALAKEFARRGARVIMAGRSQIPQAGEKIRAETGSTVVEMRYVDLSSIPTVHSLVNSLSDEGIVLDLCILNAAVALPRARKTDAGQDVMFQVNYLSNVVLSSLLLKKGVILPSDVAPRPRILFISSDSHQGSSAIDYGEFGRYFEYGVSKGISNYSYFKLVLNTYATELSRRVNRENVRVGIHAICPGPVHSNIVKEAPAPLRILLKAIFRVIFKSPAKAALPVVYMGLSEDFEGRTNEYLHMFNPKKMDPKVYDPKEGSTLWSRSYELLEQIDPQFADYSAEMS